MSGPGQPTTESQEFVEPFGDRLLVRRDAADTLSKSGRLIIPDQAKEKPSRGTVVAIGPGRILENGTRVPIAIAVGDEVLFGKYSGSDIKFGETDLLLIREDEVFCRVRRT